jgi:regulatory protein
MAMPARGRAGALELREGVITSLVSRRGHADRVGVHLDGHFAFDLAAMVADRAGLRAGDLLGAERQQELVTEDAPYRARERALRFLGVRDHSPREVETRLRQAGFDSAVVAETVAWLGGLDYLNERRFAAAYAAEKRRSGWGARRIRAELGGKGVERSVIDEVLALEEADMAGPGDGSGYGAEALEQTVRRRFLAQFGTDPDAAERRLAGFLARRGYDWDTIVKMARTLRAEAAERPSPPGVP